MKSLFIVIGFLTLSTSLVLSALASKHDDVADKQIAQAIQSQDLDQIIKVLPVIEKLWPQQPKDYFENAKKAAGVLDLATTNSRAIVSMVNLFSNVIEKPFLIKSEPDVSCLEEKNDAVLYFLNFNEVRNEKLGWIAIAKYIGQIRDQADPNFVPKTVYRNPPGLMDASPEKARQIIAENEKNKVINKLQPSLQMANSMLTFHLLHNAPRFSASNPTNVEFIKNIISVAHLTAEEQRQLGN